MQLQHSPEEAKLLELLKEFQQVLADAINSLDEKAPPPATAECAYLQWAAVAVNRASEGYLRLREAYRVNASKLLIRPMIEAVFAGTAVMKKPGFLWRKAYSEWEEELKMFPNMTPAERAAVEKHVEDFKKALLAAQPGYPIVSSRASVWDTASEAGMTKIYDTAYRIYCKFTHGALGAVAGALNELTDDVNSQIVICCIVYILELLKTHTPAKVPDLNAMRKRLPFGT